MLLLYSDLQRRASSTIHLISWPSAAKHMAIGLKMAKDLFKPALCHVIFTYAVRASVEMNQPLGRGNSLTEKWRFIAEYDEF